jgi:hypothetical protein
MCWKTHPNNNSQTNLFDGYNSLIFPNYNKRSQRLETRPLGSNLWISTMENDELNFLNLLNMLKALFTFFWIKVLKVGIIEGCIIFLHIVVIKTHWFIQFNILLVGVKVVHINNIVKKGVNCCSKHNMWLFFTRTIITIITKKIN